VVISVVIGPDALTAALEGGFLPECCIYFGEEEVGGEMSVIEEAAGTLP